MNLLERTLRWSADRVPVCKPLYYHDPGCIPTAREAAKKLVVQNSLTSLTHTRSLPVWSSDSVIDEYKPLCKVSFNPKPLYFMEDVEVVGGSGFIKSADGRFPLEQAWGSSEVLKNCLEYNKRRWGRPKVVKEPVFHLSGLAANNYFHWLHDILPRLFGVTDKLPENVRWLVPSPLLEFQQSTLDRLNIGKDRLLPLMEGSYRFSSLFYSPYWGRGAFDAPEVVKWLAGELSTQHGNGCQPMAQKKIYVSRQSASRRKIVNQQEVEAFLFKSGFEEVFPEKLNFAEQHALFSQAKIVCGVHGAGFANLLFCPRGAGCIEIHGIPVRDAVHYWSIADSAGLNYAVVACKRQGGGHNDDDLRVDVAELAKAIDCVLSL